MAARLSCDDARVQRVAAWFEALTPQALAQIGDVYAPQARFKDPFNDVSGLPAIRGVFEHMYRALAEPRFEVLQAVVQGDDCFLVWDFRFRFRRFDDAAQCVRGTSHLQLDARGRIVMHRDYWDTAEELYEKLPVVGTLMRWLRRRARS